MAANSTGIPVRIRCIAVLARSTALGVTGRDWGIQMLFPSRETDGAAISFMEASRQSIAQSRTATLSGRPDKTSVSTGRISRPMTRSSTPLAGMRIIARPQLSI